MKLIKEKKVIFEDEIPNMKTDMNCNLSTQTIEKSKRMEYSDKIVKLVAIFIEYLRNIKAEKDASFTQRCFLHNGLNSLDDKDVTC